VTTLPKTANTPVVRTDFSNAEKWLAIRAAICKPQNAEGYDFHAQLDFVDDSQFRNATAEELLTMLTADYEHVVLFVVDAMATAHPESPILVVSCCEPRGRTFRTTPSQVQGIENNLSIANMDFDEFADSVDGDRVFRGFREL